MTSCAAAHGESSAEIKKRVDAARERQHARFAGDGSMCNARIGSAGLREFCALNAECEELMKAAFSAMNLSGRSYDRILRVARTIADLAGRRISRPSISPRRYSTVPTTRPAGYNTAEYNRACIRVCADAGSVKF